MVRADVRATIAVAVVCIVTLFGELWFSWSYVCAGSLLTVAAVWLTADPRVQLSRDEKAGLVFLAWGVLAAYLVSQAYLDSKTTLASWTAAWLVWVAVSRSTRAGRRLIASILVAVAVLSAGAVLAEFIGLARPRAGGLFSNPNLTVAVIAPVLVLFLSVFRRRWLAWVVLIAVALSILLTGSRAGFLAVGAVALVVLPAGRMRRSVMVLGGAGLAMLMVWRTLANPESLAWHRWRIWRAVIEMTVEHPLFGIGAGNLGEAMGPYRLCHPHELGQWSHVIGAAESTPLGILARVGLPGAVLALLVVVLWLGRCRTLQRRRAGVVAAIAVIALFHDVLGEPAILWWWAAVLALVTPRAPPRTGEYPKVGLRLVPAIAVGGITAWALLQPAWANVVWWSGASTSASAERVVRIEPWHSGAMKRRVEDLLRLPVWTWDEASEARYWSDQMLVARSGAASTWALRGAVDSRVIAELGAWKATVTEARAAFVSAASIEPRLPWYPYHHALLERNLGNLGVARALAVRATESEPDFVRGWLLVARLDLDRGDVVAASAARSKALEAIGKGRGRARTAYQFGLLEHSQAQLQALARELP